MGRPKCVAEVEYMCDRGFPCVNCERGYNKLGRPIMCEPFTTAEKVAALTVALEELTNMRWVMIDKPKE